MSNLISVNSVIKLNLPMIRKLTEAQTTALEQTAEALTYGSCAGTGISARYRKSPE